MKTIVDVGRLNGTRTKRIDADIQRTNFKKLFRQLGKVLYMVSRWIHHYFVKWNNFGVLNENAHNF